MLLKLVYSGTHKRIPMVLFSILPRSPWAVWGLFNHHFSWRKRVTEKEGDLCRQFAEHLDNSDALNPSLT